MKKNTLIRTIALILITSLMLTACQSSPFGAKENSAGNGTYDYDDYSCDGYTDYDDSNDGYVEYDDEYNKSSILTSPDDYEPGNGSSSEVYYAEINEYVKYAFGLTYPEVEDLNNASAKVVHLLDESPDTYGIEYPDNKNCTYMFRMSGQAPYLDSDTCVGVRGWFSRIMDFDHEWAAYITDLENSLRDTYPDCSSVQFTSTSSIPDAPTNISDTLAYVDFTATFYNAEPTKVRLYVEASSESSIVYSDAWTLLCIQGDF